MVCRAWSIVLAFPKCTDAGVPGNPGVVVDVVVFVEEAGAKLAGLGEAGEGCGEVGQVLQGLALGGAPLDIGLGGLGPVHAGDDGTVQGGVGLAVPTAVEVVVAGLAGGRWDRVGAAERSEGGFAAEPLRVVAGAHEKRSGAVGSDAGELDERRGSSGGQCRQFRAQGLGLRAQGEGATGEKA